MLKKMLALLLCGILTLGVLAACGDEPAQVLPNQYQPENQPTTQSAPAGNDTTAAPTEETKSAEIPTETTEPAEATMGNPNTVIGTGVEYSVTQEVRIDSYNSKGFVYRTDDGKKGIRSLDGTYDSGAVYIDAEAMGDYFTVQESEYGEPDDFPKINSTGMVDCYGNIVIPPQYAMIKKVNDRAYRAYAVTEVTESDVYLLYMHKGLFSLSAGKDDTRYLGNWCIYDAQTGKEIPGLAGTTATSVYANGDVLTFTENDKKVRKNINGQDIPLDCSLYEDGSYMPKGEKTVYDAYGNKLFDVDHDGYEVLSWYNGYYRMRKYENGTNTYVLADAAGNICAGPFDFSPTAQPGGLVTGNKAVYDMQGNLLLDKDCYMIYYHEGYWLLRDYDKNVYLMDSQYNAELICVADGDISLYGHQFAVTKKENDTNYYYSITKKDYAEGYPTAMGLAERKTEDGKKELVNTMTDEVILSGYSQYLIVEGEDRYCIYASTGRGVYDIFYVG